MGSQAWCLFDFFPKHIELSRKHAMLQYLQGKQGRLSIILSNIVPFQRLNAYILRPYCASQCCFSLYGNPLHTRQRCFASYGNPLHASQRYLVTFGNPLYASQRYFALFGNKRATLQHCLALFGNPLQDSQRCKAQYWWYFNGLR